MQPIKKVLIFSGLLVMFGSITANAQVNLPVPTEVAGRAVKSAIWRGQELQFIEGEIALKVERAASQTEVQQLVRDVNAEIVYPFDALGWGLIKLPKGADEMNAINLLNGHSLVLSAEPNLVTYAFKIPNDRYFNFTTPRDPYQWSLWNNGDPPSNGADGADIKAKDAWDITTGNSDVVIAVLDTGIPIENGQLSHPDLNDPSKILIGPDYVDDGEGVRDLNAHGTHVAGIASAETDNTEGIAGVSWNSKILVIQVFDREGYGTSNSFYQGVVHPLTSSVLASQMLS